MPLNESPLRDHPLNPMRIRALVRVLARQSRAPVGLVDLATVARGVEAVRARLRALAGEGHGAAIADAVFDGDLAVLGAAALDARVSTGASASASASPGPDRRRKGRGQARRDGRRHRARRTGGLPRRSCSQATLAQVAAAEAVMPSTGSTPAACSPARTRPARRSPGRWSGSATARC